MPKEVFCINRPYFQSDPWRYVHYRWVIVIMGLLTTLGAHGFGRFAYSMINPSMISGLGLSYTQVGTLATGNSIGYLVLALMGGVLATQFGTRFVISLSLALMGITMVLTGMARTYNFAVSMRILTGLGHGGAFVPALALGSIWFSKKRRGFATGIVMAGAGIGFALSGMLVPAILSSYGTDGWRYCWYYLGLIVLLLSCLAYVSIRNRPEDLGPKPLGLKKTEAGGSGTEKTGELEWKKIYKIGSLWRLGAVYFMFGSSYIIYFNFFGTFLIKEIGWTHEQAGRLFTASGVFSIFCGLLWGYLSDLIGRRGGAAIAFLILAVSYGIFALLRSPVAYYVSALLFGLTVWSIPTIMAAAVGDYAGPKLAPAGLGFVTLFFGIGQAIGPAIGGFMADFTGSFTLSFLLAAGVSLGGIVGLLTLKNPRIDRS